MKYFRITMTLLSLAISASAIYLCNETWWIRHAGDDFTTAPQFALASEIYKMAWKVAVHTLVVVIIITLILRYILKIRDAWNVACNVFKPLPIGGAIAFMCSLPVPELDAVARMILPVVMVCCVVRFIQHFNAYPITFMGVNVQPRHAGWVVFMVAFVIHLIPWWNVTTRVLDGNRDYLLTGDQPAYLYMTDSLVMDCDLDVSNNFLPENVYHRDDGRHAGGVERHNRDLSPGSPEYESRAKAFGQAMYSTHRPGISIIISPLYYIGTLTGDYHRAISCLLLVFITALAIRELTLACIKLTGKPFPSLLLGLAVAVSAPVSVMSVAIFPETFMFFIVARMIRLTIHHNLTWPANLEMGIWLAVAPWLQDKYVIWLLPFVITRVVFLWPHLRSIALPAIPVIASALLMLKFNLLLFGQFLPKNTLGRFLTFREAVWSGLPGTWFDWGFGLIMLAPFCLFSLAGIVMWWRKHGRSAVPLATLLSCLAVLIAGKWIIGTWWCWWGGFAPPNRFMFSLLPIAALFSMLATVYSTGWMRSFAIAIWLFSTALGLDALLHPELWYTSDLPSATISSIFGWDAFMARYHPMLPGDLSANMRGLFIALAGMVALIGLAWHAWTGKSNIANYYFIVPMVLLLALAGIPAAGVSSPTIKPDDIPFRVGVIQDQTIENSPDHRYLFRCKLYYRKLHGPLALGVHFLNEQGKVIGQADFDLNDYRKDWIHASSEHRTQWEISHTVSIARPLHPTADTKSVRIRPYNPALAKSCTHHLRGEQHVLPLP